VQRSHSQLDRGSRLAESLEKMVRAGRLTEEEAARLIAAAAADQPREFDAVVQKIQGRHARARVAAALGAGDITPEAAQAMLARLDEGEDPRFLRGLGRRSRRWTGSA
jgi:lipase chaperone LimK